MKRGLQDTKQSFRTESWSTGLSQNRLDMASSTPCSPKPTIKPRPLLSSVPSHTVASPMVSLFFLFVLFCFVRVPPPSDYEHVEGRDPTTLKARARLWSDGTEMLSFDEQMREWETERWRDEWPLCRLSDTTVRYVFSSR